MSLKADKGLDVHRLNGTTTDLTKIDAYLPTGGGLFTLKLCFGIAFL